MIQKFALRESWIRINVEILEKAWKREYFLDLMIFLQGEWYHYTKRITNYFTVHPPTNKHTQIFIIVFHLNTPFIKY